MNTFEEQAKEFLGQKRIAVAGVSRSGQDTGNGIFRMLRDAGYEVFPVNPHAQEVEGVACYPDLAAIPGGVDGVVAVTRPEDTATLIRDAIAAGVPRVWMHENGFFKAGSSVSDEAVALGRDSGLTVIAGGCPLMFMEFGHKCMRWIMRVTGRLPA